LTVPASSTERSAGTGVRARFEEEDEDCAAERGGSTVAANNITQMKTRLRRFMELCYARSARYPPERV
jgi:hypothetical protein